MTEQTGNDAVRPVDWTPIVTNPWVNGLWIVCGFGLFTGLLLLSARPFFGAALISTGVYAGVMAIHGSALKWEPSKRTSTGK